jgi:hypothetical protein
MKVLSILKKRRLLISLIVPFIENFRQMKANLYLLIALFTMHWILPVSKSTGQTTLGLTQLENFALKLRPSGKNVKF